MSHNILVLGESGTGKSTSIRTLPPSETFILNVLNKPLPFRGAKKKYQRLSPDGVTGNFYSADDAHSVMRVLNLVNQKRPDIKYLVIDDFGYTISNQFMRKALERGFDKFSEIGQSVFNVFTLLQTLRDDLYVFVMMHTEIDANNRSKPRTIGKLIDEKICIEGHFTYVFHSMVSDNRYIFLTNNNGTHMAKTPMGSFEELHIDNDLMAIVEKIKQYEDE